MELIERILNGDRRALAKAISIVENHGEGAKELMNGIYQYTGNAHIIGFTGPPGVGKSSLISELALYLSARGKSVGIIAIDPTSPFSGGAILGDRIRMGSLELNSKIFIRSMATRGGMGGLSRAAGDVAKLMDAFKLDVVIVETVGAGQSDVDIINIVETAIVVLSPNLGDDIQTLKAGMLEIADIYVVNKTDLEGSEQAIIYLESMLGLGKDRYDGWKPPVIGTSMVKKEGLDELAASIDRHHEFMNSLNIKEKKRRALYNEIKNILQDEMTKIMNNLIETDNDAKNIMNDLYNNAINPYAASDRLLKKILCTKEYAK